MPIELTKDGIFSMPIKPEVLSKGLRRSKSNYLNSDGLIYCAGAVGREGVLQRLDELVKTFDLTSTFPYPQIFIEPYIILVCTATHIYEYDGSNLILKISTAVVGSTWSLITVEDFVYMSNGSITVVRDPISNIFSITSDHPTAMAICNYNGQIIIGAPNAGYNLGD